MVTSSMVERPARPVSAGWLLGVWIGATLAGMSAAVVLNMVLQFIVGLIFWEKARSISQLVLMIGSGALAFLPLAVFQSWVLERAFGAQGWRRAHGRAWQILTAAAGALFVPALLFPPTELAALSTVGLALGIVQGLVLAALPAPTWRVRLLRSVAWAATGLVAALAGALVPISTDAALIVGGILSQVLVLTALSALLLVGLAFPTGAPPADGAPAEPT
jgi:hypothetical protein